MIDAQLTPAGNLIDVTLINSLFAAEGMSIAWYPARNCDCWSEIQGVAQASGSPDPSCPDCKGDGRTYPVRYQIQGVILDGMQNIASWNADSGVNYLGTIRMLVPAISSGQPVPLYLQGALDDLVLAQDILLPSRNVVQRGRDSLNERPATPVSITWGAATYYEGTDFRVTGKTINWISAGPPTGTQYEASYSFHPWFNIVQGMAIARNFAHLKLPRTFVLELNHDMGEAYPLG